MMEQTQPVRPMTEEEIKFEKMTKQIEKLEKIVGALAVTNFLTQHEDGDEEVREQSVVKVNEFAREFKDDCIAAKKIAELEAKKWDIDQEIQNIKWGGRLKIKASGRYATGLGSSIISTQTAMVNALNQSFQNAYDAKEAQSGLTTISNGSK